MSREISQYKIFNEIGKGSFGKVYKGVDKLTGEEVALKFIEKKQKRSRDLKNLREENELLKKINHPNVIALKDVIETPKEIIIVTDYAGRDLSGVIEQVKRFPLDKVKDYSTQILNAMLYLNENRIIHRDLKPQNILIKGNHIKLCDFGFAKKLSASTNFLQSMKGTPLYLAPQIVRETKYTEKVDIWSFGCIIYELFTGRTPYYANTFQKLAPLILYQQVQYPKEMPAELKELISSMLQKNPSARPDWKQLKNHIFFKQNQPLKDKIQNALKEVVSIEIPEKSYVPEIHRFPENKQNKIPNREQEFIESKVIQKLANENQLKSYESEFNKIHIDLVGNVIDGKELRRDIIFLHKVKKVFHERSQSNPLITNELLEATINILNHLLKMRKNRNNSENTNEVREEDDITQNEALVFGLLCLAKVEKNYDLLEKELRLIGKFVKGTFNGIAINSEIDEQITEFMTEILLQNSTKLPISCINMGLIVIGVMVNQAFTTLANSYTYFERVAEDNLLSKIAGIYKKEERYGTVLELLKTIIHPVKEFKNMTGNNPHHNLPSKLERVFHNLKEEVAEALMKTDFISEVSPLQVYGEKSPAIIDYCEILLQCLEVSPAARKQFLKHSYWPSFLTQKRLRAYLFAYNMTFLNYENKCILSNDQIAKYTQESHQNRLVINSIVWIGCFKIRTKPQNVAAINYKQNILERLFDGLFYDEGLKKNNLIEVYGILHTTTKQFDQPLIQLFYNIITELKTENCQEFKDLLQSIFTMFKKICNTSCPFKPNNKSLYLLMTLFTENQFISKNVKFQKSVQLFFYDCISDFIRRQDFEYLENDFEEKQIPAFIAKIINCLNFLNDAEDNQSKTSNLSLNAMNITKEIQSAGLYRIMFIDGLTDEQFYEHLKYSQRVISKTTAMPEFVNFLGVKVIPMCKHYINTKLEPLLTEICLFISLLARDHSQFNTNILETGIIKKVKEWLSEEKYSESVKEKALYLVGNLAKRSEFFFDEFQAHSVMEAITICLKSFSANSKILKNTIYSIGNISFYSQKFYKQIEPMIPYFAKAFDLSDTYIRSNMISTVSNLLRFSSIFLSQLIKIGLIGNILKLACEGQVEQSTAGLIMSLMKKILPYEEFYQVFGVKELKIIYQRRQVFGGDGNQTIRKIRQVLVARRELN